MRDINNRILGSEDSDVPEMSDPNEAEHVESVFNHVKELAKLKYEAEQRREDSLIQQSSNMQMAFSFVTAAVFTATPVIISYRGELCLEFFLAAISSIVFALLLSLYFASRAQLRVKMTQFPNIANMEAEIKETYFELIPREVQIEQWLQIVGEVQESLSEENDRKVNSVRYSMNCFFVALGLILFWFVLGIFILFI